MALRDIHYLPGESVCLAGPGVVLITDLAPASPVVTACWEALTSGQDADAVIDIVCRDVPPGSARVAIAAPDDRSVRLVLGGAGAHAVVAGAGGAPVSVSAPASTWLDERYPGAAGVRLAVQPSGAAATDIDGPLPIRTAVALASVAILGVVDVLAPAVDGDEQYRPQHGAPATETADPGATEEADLQVPADPPDPADPADPGPADAAGELEQGDAPAAEWLAPEAFGVASDDDIAQPVEEIVPAVEPSGVAPTVLAVSCPDGHLGPPYDNTCRVCGAAIPPQGPFSAPRPPLGSLELSSGARIRLDRDTVIGRSPTDGAVAPEEAVQLVRVPSPNNDVSRNHVRISLEGWHVLVTDLGSTNGTLVTQPDREPVQLRPHDAMTIAPGTVVTLADEISMRFDPRG